MASEFLVTEVEAETLSPHHYHSLAVPSGTATLAEFMSDRAMSFAMGNALGCLHASPLLPRMDYEGHMRRLPFIASLFEAVEPSLMKPSLRRLNIDAEASFSKKIQDATGTGNLKTFYTVQEIPIGIRYTGAYFGADPFELASKAQDREVDEIIVRTGRHLQGVVRVVRKPRGSHRIRLNAHTAMTFGRKIEDAKILEKNGKPLELRVETYALHDMQVVNSLASDDACAVVSTWLQ